INRSISAVVRYSRVRTEEFTVVGADRPAVRFPTIFCPCSKITSELSGVSSIISGRGTIRRSLPAHTTLRRSRRREARGAFHIGNQCERFNANLTRQRGTTRYRLTARHRYLHYYRDLKQHGANYGRVRRRRAASPLRFVLVVGPPPENPPR